MRTRKSNRSKRYTVEKYDFEGSSDDEFVERRAKGDDKDDDNFDAGAAEESAEDEDAALEQEALESGASVSDPEGVLDRFSRQRVKPIKPFNVRAAVSTGYTDIEPVPADGRIVRAYCGPYDRILRGRHLADAWYGQHANGVQTAMALLERWMDWTVLPPKLRLGERDEGQRDREPWSPGFFEREAFNAKHWYERVREDVERLDARVMISPEEAQRYYFGRGPMPVLMGPYESQAEVMFEPLHSYTLSHSGLPFDQDQAEDKTAAGWMLDTGGIVLGLDWAPHHEQADDHPQLLAVAVIPHSDQEDYNYEQESVNPEFERYGAVQVWEVRGERSEEEGFLRPSTQPPRLRKTLCFETGRVRRVKWAPACGLLAILSGDGSVSIVNPREDAGGSYEFVQHPISVFAIPDEETIKATSMAWVNVNRLAVGYSDGSIALWSVRPNHLLSRHPVHHNHVINMASGYPTIPYIIASASIGGVPKLLDLRGPSYEVTEVQALSVTTQPNLMAYSDHLLGFFSMYPSSGVLNTQVSFMNHAHFPITRRVFTSESFLSCIAVGRTHPYLLIGSTDGSLTAMNPQSELFTTKREHGDRIKIFQHEHRPAHLFAPESPASARGISRIVQGFVPEKNLNPKTEFKPQLKKGKKTKSKKKDGNAEEAPAEDDEEGGGPVDPTRGVIHAPLTRMMVVEWNPNEDFGCWAAVAMASGLVRIMDLGIEVPS